MNGLSTLTPAAFTARILKWLVFAAVTLALVIMLFPLAVIVVPVVLLVSVLAFLAAGIVPQGWLAYVTPAQLGMWRNAGLALLVVILVASALLLLPLPLLLFGLLVFAVLFALGWSGIGPFVWLAALVRGLIFLIRLLPLLRGPLATVYDALHWLDNNPNGIGKLDEGLNTAAMKLQDLDSRIRNISVDYVSTKEVSRSVDLPGKLPTIDVPGWEINVNHATPFAGANGVADAVTAVKDGIATAQGAAQQMHARVHDVAAAVKILHDMLPET